jgi:hypothetical protein
MCRSGMACQAADCCFSELALLKIHHHHLIENVTCSHNEKVGVKQQSLAHSISCVLYDYLCNKYTILVY